MIKIINWLNKDNEIRIKILKYLYSHYQWYHSMISINKLAKELKYGTKEVQKECQYLKDLSYIDSFDLLLNEIKFEKIVCSLNTKGIILIETTNWDLIKEKDLSKRLK